MRRNTVKKEVPRALTGIKTQGDEVTPLTSFNYNIGPFPDTGFRADSDIKTAIPLFTAKVPRSVIKDGVMTGMYLVGRCMEPTIRHGAIIGCDYNDRDLVENEIYVFELEGYRPVTQCKRLFKVLPGVGLLLATDNPLWPDYFVREGKYKVFGKVKWFYNEGVTIWGQTDK